MAVLTRFGAIALGENSTLFIIRLIDRKKCGRSVSNDGLRLINKTSHQPHTESEFEKNIQLKLPVSFIIRSTAKNNPR